MRKFLIIAMAIILATPAFAVDFKAPILQLDGKPVPLSETDKSPLTLGKVCTDALIATLPGETLTPDEKGDRFRLAMRIVNKPNDAISATDVVLIKKVVGIAYGPLVVGRVIELLDPASVPK
jgi:hypothetical protein